MKGQGTKIASIPAFVVASIVTFAAFAYSWSQNALTQAQPLLTIILLSIMFMMLYRAFNHPDKDRVIFKVKRFLIFGRLREFTQREWNVSTAIMFGLIEATPVTHSFQIVVLLHLVFTGLGAFHFFISMTHTYKKWSFWWWFFLVVAIIGFLGFGVGFLTELYSTALGEWIFALGAIVWVWISDSDKIGIRKK